MKEQTVKYEKILKKVTKIEKILGKNVKID